GFVTHSDLKANGHAMFAEGVGRLTPAENGQQGSFFTTQRVGIRHFRTTFDFRVHEGTDPRADGLTFTIQADPPGANALGDSGGALGYGGATAIVNSVAIKFDFWKAFPSGSGGHHSSTGLYVDGHTPNNDNLPPDQPVDLEGLINLDSQTTKRV